MDIHPINYIVHVESLVNSQVIEEINIHEPKPKMLFEVFSVLKDSPHNPRLIINFKLLTNHLNPPKFRLPNIDLLIGSMKKDEYLVKMELKNGFYHIKLHESAMLNIGVKCGHKYLRQPGWNFVVEDPGPKYTPSFARKLL